MLFVNLGPDDDDGDDNDDDDGDDGIDGDGDDEDDDDGGAAHRFRFIFSCSDLWTTISEVRTTIVRKKNGKIENNFPGRFPCPSSFLGILTQPL